MSVLIAPVPAPAPVQEPAMVVALRGQIARGASDAVLLRIAGAAAEYRRLARDFGLRPLAAQQVANGPKPTAPACAIERPRVPMIEQLRSYGRPEERTRAACLSGPQEGSASTRPNGIPTPPAGVPGPQDHLQEEGSALPRRRPRPKQPGELTALLRDIARVRRDLAALERRRS
ncbi:MAG: hypothetical protein KIS73_24680 [Enhydrobacter sp.]|nr:hypothetical protein [Enhydrobacter sp.]